MKENNYTVEGRTFRTELDYSRALRDKKVIDRLRENIRNGTGKDKEAIKKDILDGKIVFLTILGEDFMEELNQAKSERTHSSGKLSKEMEQYVQDELVKREKRRKLIVFISSVVAVVCLGYFGYYSWQTYRTEAQTQNLSSLKEKEPIVNKPDKNQDVVPQFSLDPEKEAKEVLDEYKNLIIINKKLIGWVKIDDTNIDYPVVQTSDNEYYLKHNLYQESDKNGTIFMDKDCDILKPSTNFIIYGHHMKSGKMFGKLDSYANKDFYEKHKVIQFDTIYEKATYEVMYVFRSHVFSEEEIAFKYYQFIDANSEVEFNSNMREMASLSLYDTGVTAEYGDQLLTLSTCDYQETNGRFVVVAKKIKE